MESMGKECTELKLKYEDCFNKWYSQKFLKGDLSDGSPCQDLFDEYKACIMVTIKEKQLDKLIAESRSALANTQLFSEPAVGADDQKKKSNKL